MHPLALALSPAIDTSSSDVVLALGHRQPMAMEFFIPLLISVGVLVCFVVLRDLSKKQPRDSRFSYNSFFGKTMSAMCWVCFAVIVIILIVSFFARIMDHY